MQKVRWSWLSVLYKKPLVLEVWFKLLVICNDFNSLVCEKQITVTIFYLSNNFDNDIRSDLIPVALTATSSLTYTQKTSFISFLTVWLYAYEHIWIIFIVFNLLLVFSRKIWIVTFIHNSTRVCVFKGYLLKHLSVNVSKRLKTIKNYSNVFICI